MFDFTTLDNFFMVIVLGRISFVSWSTRPFVRWLQTLPSTMILIHWIRWSLRTRSGWASTTRCRTLMSIAYRPGCSASNSITNVWLTKNCLWSRSQKRSLQVSFVIWFIYCLGSVYCFLVSISFAMQLLQKDLLRNREFISGLLLVFLKEFQRKLYRIRNILSHIVGHTFYTLAFPT